MTPRILLFNKTIEKDRTLQQFIDINHLQMLLIINCEIIVIL